MSKQMWIMIKLMVVLVVLIGGAIGGWKLVKSRSREAQYRKTVAKSQYMMHALGGMEGTYSYTDSIEALRENYSEGYRLFEVDVNLTSDGQPVLVHGWKKKDYQKRIGIANYDEQKVDESKAYIPTYDAFMNFTIQDHFTATDFAGLVAFMADHRDMYVMIDVGSRTGTDTVTIYSAMVEAAADNKEVLNRMIVGGHTIEMIEAVRTVYDFKLFNLYFAEEDAREERLQEPEDFIAYCKENGIQSFSVASTVFTDEVAAAFSNSGLLSYVFTVNDEQEAEHFREIGASIIGTDFLR